MGMGSELETKYGIGKDFFEGPNQILGFDIFEIMRNGTAEDLRQTAVTQPSIFLYSLALWQASGSPTADAYAGHSLGEFSALVASGCISLTAGLTLVKERANAMQAACEEAKSTMAAVLGLDDAKVEEVCAGITQEIVVPANYNTPGQLVISGSIGGIELAAERLKEAGAKRVITLEVGGAFHSPFMASAQVRLAAAVEATEFAVPNGVIYQNVDAKPSRNPDEIKAKLVAQLTSPVRWAQSVAAMAADGVDTFTEIGPGNVLQGLIKKINKELVTAAL